MFLPKRHFSKLLKPEIDVLIVGGGPVGMVLSSLLSHMKVGNQIIERAEAVQDHPKAHYISFKTCEILKDLGVEGPLEQKLEQIEQWTNFNYKSHVIGADGVDLGRVNHFQWSWRKNQEMAAHQGAGASMPTDLQGYQKLLQFYQSEPRQVGGGFTYSYPNHFSQNRLTKILDDKLASQNQRINFGVEYASHTSNPDGVEVNLKSGDKVRCKYLIGTDGTRSAVRRNLGISMKGSRNLQNFINIHFRSADVGQLMLQSGETGMLYFLYNADLISVLVCHDLEKGEFVLQVPFYPSVQKLSDFTEDKCREQVLQSIFSPASRGSGSKLKIDIVNTNSWLMEGMVADRFQDCLDSPQVFLAGDAAHAFPPSGGFGMNAGIGDAQNLAYKIAYEMQNPGKVKALKNYSKERYHINKLTKDFSMVNYQKSVDLAKGMFLNKSNLETFDSVVQTIVPSFLQKSLFQTGMNVGLKIASQIVPSASTKKFVEAENKNTIRLTFPNLDFGGPNERFLRQNWDEDVFTSDCTKVGSLVPHLLLQDDECISLRQYFQKLQLTSDKCFHFVIKPDPTASSENCDDKIQELQLKYGTIKLLDIDEEVKLTGASREFLAEQFAGKAVLVYRPDGVLAEIIE